MESKITVVDFQEKDIPDFAAEEIARDANLQQRIAEETGFNIQAIVTAADAEDADDADDDDADDVDDADDDEDARQGISHITGSATQKEDAEDRDNDSQDTEQEDD
ncbi:MAG: hypothetical protein RRX92_08280 [Lachnospiraceae bacterium]